MAQSRMKQMADKGRTEPEFAVGEEVYLKLKGPHLKSLLAGPISKLTPRYFGPFPIVAKVGKVAYKLLLPERTGIHPVFHVSLLKKAAVSEQVELLLPSGLREGTETPEPLAIIDKRVLYQQGAPLIQVLVRWSNGDDDSSTWEYLPDLLDRFPRAASLLAIS